MIGKIEFDDSNFQAGLSGLGGRVMDGKARGLQGVAIELLRLSQFEVPHDKGLLQDSGSWDWDNEETIVYYNKTYAAFQHEGGDGKRVIRNWQSGRKSKYLEDPLKNNNDAFLKIIADFIKGVLK